MAQYLQYAIDIPRIIEQSFLDFESVITYNMLNEQQLKDLALATLRHADWQLVPMTSFEGKGHFVQTPYGWACCDTTEQLAQVAHLVVHPPANPKDVKLPL